MKFVCLLLLVFVVSANAKLPTVTEIASKVAVTGAEIGACMVRTKVKNVCTAAVNKVKNMFGYRRRRLMKGPTELVKTGMWKACRAFILPIMKRNVEKQLSADNCAQLYEPCANEVVKAKCKAKVESMTS